MEIDLTEGAAAWILLEKIRWPDGLPICPHCKTKARKDRNHYSMKIQKTTWGKQSYRKFWRCWNCRNQFSALMGTPLQGSRVPVTKLFLAMHLVSQPGSVSGRELARQLGVNPHTGLTLKKMLEKIVFDGIR